MHADLHKIKPDFSCSVPALTEGHVVPFRQLPGQTGREKEGRIEY